MKIVRISDGLGNQMFQYAFARKISSLMQKMVYLDIRFINNEDSFELGKNACFKGKLAHREYGLSHFKIALPIADDRMLSHWEYLQQSDYIQKAVYALAMQNKWIYQYLKEDFNFSGELSKSGILFPAYYQGYFFDLKYYDDIRSILQHEFSLRQKMKIPADLKNLLDTGNTVSLHIRRGDFLKLNRDISGSGYYEKAIQLMESKVKSIIYLIFSDDIVWVKENMNIPGEKLYISGMGFKDYEELAIMKHCRHNIIANSTFSYWAAYLNSHEDRIVICPKRWKSKIIPMDWLRV